MAKTAPASVPLDSPPQNPDYCGLVDIGSNGIRLSITDLTPPTMRIMPTLYQSRLGISLYSAQFRGHERVPIPADVVASVTSALSRFKRICASFGVPSSSVSAVATEATRTAPNSAEFISAIKKATGWDVELLSHAEEGHMGAWGVASSLPDATGLVMDLGGGSTQLSWLVSSAGQVKMAAKPVSLPYGAAALSRRMQSQSIAPLKTEIYEALSSAYKSLSLPPELQDKSKGINLYLSGGGFRGFGYLLLDNHKLSPYPIPIINGFRVRLEETADLVTTYSTKTPDVGKVFRISARRAAQVPAVALLVKTLIEVLPRINTVTFCQGGVREGRLYSTLPLEIRTEDPLVVATTRFAPASVGLLYETLKQAVPASAPAAVKRIVRPVANMLRAFVDVPKESRAACGLRTTTTGPLAGVHGLSHLDRATLALTLCARWGGEVVDTGYKERLGKLVGGEIEFWCRYLGAVAGLVGAVYPAGRVCKGQEGLKVVGKELGEKVEVLVVLGVGMGNGEMVEEELEDIEKVGKKKKCALGYRKAVAVRIME